MSAPARQPSYFDGSETGLEPAWAMGYLIDSFAAQPKYFPDWIVEDSGVEVDLALLAHEPGRLCSIGFAGGGISGAVTFAPDASGWLLVTAEIAGAEVFRGYLDRPYEQYEIWPQGAAPGAADEAPARIGKREHWVGIDMARWPAVAALAGGQEHFFCIVDEARLRLRMTREEQLRAK